MSDKTRDVLLVNIGGKLHVFDGEEPVEMPRPREFLDIRAELGEAVRLLRANFNPGEDGCAYLDDYKCWNCRVAAFLVKHPAS